MYATKKDTPERLETADRITAAIGLREHIKRNYVPWALTNIALYHVKMHLKESARLRLRSIKLSDRTIRELVASYERRARAVTGDDPACEALEADFNAASKRERFLAQLQSREDASNDEDCLEPDQGLHGALAYELLALANRIDNETDEMLTEILRTTVRRKKEPELIRLRAILYDYRRRGYAPELSEDGHKWIKAIVARAIRRADELVDLELGEGREIAYPQTNQ